MPFSSHCASSAAACVQHRATASLLAALCCLLALQSELEALAGGNGPTGPLGQAAIFWGRCTGRRPDSPAATARACSLFTHGLVLRGGGGRARGAAKQAGPPASTPRDTPTDGSSPRGAACEAAASEAAASASGQAEARVTRASSRSRRDASQESGADEPKRRASGGRARKLDANVDSSEQGADEQKRSRAVRGKGRVRVRGADRAGGTAPAQEKDGTKEESQPPAATSTGIEGEQARSRTGRGRRGRRAGRGNLSGNAQTDREVAVEQGVDPGGADQGRRPSEAQGLGNGRGRSQGARGTRGRRGRRGRGAGQGEGGRDGKDPAPVETVETEKEHDAHPKVRQDAPGRAGAERKGRRGEWEAVGAVDREHGVVETPVAPRLRVSFKDLTPPAPGQLPKNLFLYTPQSPITPSETASSTSPMRARLPPQPLPLDVPPTLPTLHRRTRARQKFKVWASLRVCVYA
jgi:hypothetical protein